MLDVLYIRLEFFMKNKSGLKKAVFFMKKTFFQEKLNFFLKL